MNDRKILWNAAARSGLALGGVSSAYMLLQILMQKIPTGGLTGGIASAAGILLWAGKLVLCIWLMKHFIKQFAASNEGVTNRDSFRFGNATALLSALVFAGFSMAWYTFVQPDAFADAVDQAMAMMSSSITPEVEEQMEAIKDKGPTLSFFGNFIWCWLIGMVLAAIFSRNIPPRNPFAGEASSEED